MHFLDGRIEIWEGDSDHSKPESGRLLFTIPNVEQAEMMVKYGNKTKNWKLTVIDETDHLVTALSNQSEDVLELSKHYINE